MLLTARQLTRRSVAALSMTIALVASLPTSAALAHQQAVRAHIAIGCSSVGHERGARSRHHGHRSARCQATLKGHLLMAHAA
jgi:hypothetical protein